MADTDKIRLEIREYILGEFLKGEDSSSLTDDTKLGGGNGILTSIDTIKLISWLEDRYSVSFDASDVAGPGLDTVTSIVDTVAGKRGVADKRG